MGGGARFRAASGRFRIGLLLCCFSVSPFLRSRFREEPTSAHTARFDTFTLAIFTSYRHIHTIYENPVDQRTP